MSYLDPNDWFRAEQRGGVWVIHNVTKRQDLMGEYGTCQAAEKMIDAIRRQGEFAKNNAKKDANEASPAQEEAKAPSRGRKGVRRG